MGNNDILLPPSLREAINFCIKWLKSIQNDDGSWMEINCKLKDLELIKHKIVYTNQVLRSFGELNISRDEKILKGVNFISNAPLIEDDGLYDYALRFYPIYYYGQPKKAYEIAFVLAGKMKSYGTWEFRRHHLLYFGAMFGVEILLTYREKFSPYINKALEYLLSILNYKNYWGPPSINSWGLRLFKRANKLELLREKGINPKDILKSIYSKLNESSSLWNFDGTVRRDTITYEIQCEFNTTSHILINLSELIDLMTESEIVNYLIHPLQALYSNIKKDESRQIAYWEGLTGKPDPYITALCLRAINSINKLFISRAIKRDAHKKRRLLDKIYKLFEG